MNKKHTYSLKVFIMLLPCAEALGTISIRQNERQARLLIVCPWLKHSMKPAVCSKPLLSQQTLSFAPTCAHCWKPEYVNIIIKTASLLV